MTTATHPTPTAVGVPPRLRLVTGSGLDGLNPYWRLFYRALAARGVVCTGVGSATAGWLAGHPGRVDVFHVHFTERLGRSPPLLLGRLLRPLPLPRDVRWEIACRLYWPAAVLGFRRFLRACRARGVRVVWTVHDLDPHDRRSLAADLGHRLLARYADLVIGHSQSAAAACGRRYAPRGRVVVMPHGNYDGCYPASSPPRAEVLAGVGLDPARPVVACVGELRRNKGTELACEAVARLGGRVQLLIAGPPGLTGSDRVRAWVGRLPYARWVDRQLSDAEYAAFVRAADAVVLPYRWITSSGSVLAAMTLGRGVIAADLPLFREVLGDHPAAGALFRAGDPADLAAAIDRYLRVPADDRHRAARAVADAHAWDEVIRPVADAMADWQPAPDPATRS